VKTAIAIVLAAWFGLVFGLAYGDGFVRPPDVPPVPILLGVTLPILGFLLLYAAWPAFRRTVLNADVRLLTAIQAWRAGGLGFLALAANGVLPNAFALPAGYGDILIGATAPWVMLALIRRPEFIRSWVFVAWNLLGILDLVIAVSMGALGTGIVPGIVDTVTTAPMARLPLVLIPAYLVPLFVMLHLTVLFQSWRSAGVNGNGRPAEALFAGRIEAADLFVPARG
jgi:hypothetical protein